MKKSIILIYILCSLNVFSQNTNTWEKAYGTNGYDIGVNSVQLPDSSIILCNNSTLDAHGFNQVLLIQIDTNGNELWSQNYSINNMATQATDIIISSDNKLIVSGTCNTTASAYDFFIMKFDLDGTLVWAKTYGGNDWDICNEICETADNKLVACGYTYSYGNGNTDIYILQTDLNGDSLNSSTYGNAKDNHANALCALNDSGFLVAGYYERDTISIKDAIILKYDKNFNLVWVNNYGDTNNYIANSITYDSVSNKAAFVCSLFDTNANILDPKLICINQEYKPDSILWELEYLFANEMFDVIFDYEKQTFLTVGYGGSTEDIMYYKFNINGVYIKGGVAGTNYEAERGYSISSFNTGGYIICGSTTSYNFSKDEIFIIKTNNDLESDAYNSIIENNDNYSIDIYPNPTNDYIYIKFDQYYKQDAVLQIFNNNGQIMLFDELNNRLNKINLSKFKNGIYYLNIYQSGIKFNKIIIISK